MEVSSIPPQSIESEESILSGCILFKEIAESSLDCLIADDFYRTAHQKIFKAISAVYRDEEKIDIVLLTEHLKRAGSLEEIGGATYLAKLIEAPIPVDTEQTCGIVKQKSTLRKIIEVSQNNIKRCYDGDETALDIAQKDILAIDSGVRCEAQTIGELIPDQIDYLERLSKRDGYITGIESGFFELDKITCGFQDGDLILLAARPGMGKTAIALNIARNMEEPVVIFSLEMSKNQLINRALSFESEIDGQKFRSGKFTQVDWHALTEAAGRLSKLPIAIIDDSGMHYQDIIRESRRLKKKEGIKMVIVDYLQFIEGDERKKENYKFGEISKHMKRLARSLSLPVIVLAQLNRKLEERSNPYKRPRLSDLRDSGNLEQDADLIMFLYRPEVYNEKDRHGYDQPGVAEAIVAKHRNGPTGTIRLQWAEEFTKFRNLVQ